MNQEQVLLDTDTLSAIMMKIAKILSVLRIIMM